MKFFWTNSRPSNDISTQVLIDILENGNKEELTKILWQNKSRDIIYLPITFQMLTKLTPPKNQTETLSVHELHKGRHFTLVILKTPWVTDDFPFSPILVQNKTNKIIGIMLAFNELDKYFSNNETKDISDLAIKWTGFAIRQRMG